MSDDVDGFGSRRGMQPFVDGFLRVVRDDLRSAKSKSRSWSERERFLMPCRLRHRCWVSACVSRSSPRYLGSDIVALLDVDAQL
jgi:hypothetical protein